MLVIHISETAAAVPWLAAHAPHDPCECTSVARTWFPAPHHHTGHEALSQATGAWHIPRAQKTAEKI